MSEELLLDSAKTVPVATIGGAQAGRETPKQRKQKMLASMKKKSRPEIPAEVLAFEKSRGISVPDKEDDVDPVPSTETNVTVADKPKRSPRRQSPAVQRKKIVISMELDGIGTYKTPAYDVVDANYGFFVVLPKGDNDTIFMPGIGTSVVISTPDGTKRKCYYPGVVAEFPMLNACVLAFIKADEDA